jgi:hypothetical protein
MVCIVFQLMIPIIMMLFPIVTSLIVVIFMDSCHIQIMLLNFVFVHLNIEACCYFQYLDCHLNNEACCYFQYS